MSKKKGGDSSLLIGLVLGLVVGAAVAIILADVMREDNSNAPKKLAEAKSRIEGAAEGAE